MSLDIPRNRLKQAIKDFIAVRDCDDQYVQLINMINTVNSYGRFFSNGELDNIVHEACEER